jgi:hypothetical protein
VSRFSRGTRPHLEIPMHRWGSETMEEYEEAFRAWVRTRAGRWENLCRDLDDNAERNYRVAFAKYRAINSERMYEERQQAMYHPLAATYGLPTLESRRSPADQGTAQLGVACLAGENQVVPMSPALAGTQASVPATQDQRRTVEAPSASRHDSARRPARHEQDVGDLVERVERRLDSTRRDLTEVERNVRDGLASHRRFSDQTREEISRTNETARKQRDELEALRARLEQQAVAHQTQQGSIAVLEASTAALLARVTALEAATAHRGQSSRQSYYPSTGSGYGSYYSGGGQGSAYGRDSY